MAICPYGKSILSMVLLPSFYGIGIAALKGSWRKIICYRAQQELYSQLRERIALHIVRASDDLM